MPTNYQNTTTGRIVTECELYDGLFCGCSKKYYVGWSWENLTTHEIKTGWEWRDLWKVTPPTCPEPTCADPNCPNGREIAYLNIIESVTVADISGQFIQLTINSATFIDNESPVPPTPDYIVDYGDGSPTESLTIGVPSSLHTAPDGVYIGTITWADAVFQFWYEFSFGILASYQVERNTVVTANLDCDIYPNYEIGLSDATTISSLVIRRYRGVVFANVVYSSGATGVSYSASGQLISDLSSLPDDQIIATYTYNNGVSDVDITNTGVLRTQCQ